MFFFGPEAQKMLLNWMQKKIFTSSIKKGRKGFFS